MTFNCSDKKSVQWLLTALKSIGLKHVVLSPGSRNAPLIISFANSSSFECYNMVDERSAAFYALGMAKQLNEPVAICCTSGSAVLNYAPAISEAYYQEIPLVVITADRPPELIDQEDGQTIHQENIFSNYIKNSINLSPCNQLENETLHRQNLIDTLAQSVQYPKGPVHINIPFNEPLYQTTSFQINESVSITEQLTPTWDLTLAQKDTWEKAKKIVIIVGQMAENKDLEAKLMKLMEQKNIFVLATPLSNLNQPISTSVESLVYNSKPEGLLSYAPELLITLGGSVVSKALKQFIRKVKPTHHWDIDVNPKTIDTYQCLSDKITSTPTYFLDQLINLTPNINSNFQELWAEKREFVSAKREEFVRTQGWNDFSIYNTFLRSITNPIELHLANSTPVRYIELFDKHPQIAYHCNRGTSGIDGCSSTAAGSALMSDKPCYLITGDLSFLYDSNALWNNHLPNNLKIIIINNQGGNIFKIIKGPTDSKQLEHFQANTPAKIRALCETFSVNYFSASDENSLKIGLKKLKNATKCAALEIFTTPNESAESYRNYFKFLME